MKGIEVAAIGRLGRDAELRHVKGGELALLAFSMVVDEPAAGDDAAGTWLQVAVFGEKAEALAGKLPRGARVYAEGKLRLETFTGRDGKERASLKITASLVQPLAQIGQRRPKPVDGQERQAPRTTALAERHQIGRQLAEMRSPRRRGGWSPPPAEAGEAAELSDAIPF